MTPNGQLTNRSCKLELESFFPRSKGSESYTEVSSPRVLYKEDKPPEYLALKASRAYFPERQRAVGNRDPTLKGHPQNLTHSRTQGRSSLGQTHLLILESLPKRQRQLELIPET